MPVSEPSSVDHTARFLRYSRGQSIPWNRPVYGYRVVCSCGWERRVNGTKREAEQDHRAHKRSAS